MKERYFFSFTVLLAFFITSISLPSMALATEDVSITHVVKNYVVDGPTGTVTLNIQVQNNSGAVLNDVVVRPTPMPKDMLFMGIMNIESLFMGNIAVGASIFADYIITGRIVLTQEEITETSVFWEVRYDDEAGQKKGAIAVSGLLVEGGEL